MNNYESFSHPQKRPRSTPQPRPAPVRGKKTFLNLADLLGSQVILTTHQSLKYEGTLTRLNYSKHFVTLENVRSAVYNADSAPKVKTYEEIEFDFRYVRKIQEKPKNDPELMKPQSFQNFVSLLANSKRKKVKTFFNVTKPQQPRRPLAPYANGNSYNRHYPQMPHGAQVKMFNSDSPLQYETRKEIFRQQYMQQLPHPQHQHIQSRFSYTVPREKIYEKRSGKKNFALNPNAPEFEPSTESPQSLIQRNIEAQKNGHLTESVRALFQSQKEKTSAKSKKEFVLLEIPRKTTEKTIIVKMEESGAEAEKKRKNIAKKRKERKEIKMEPITNPITLPAGDFKKPTCSDESEKKSSEATNSNLDLANEQELEPTCSDESEKKSSEATNSNLDLANEQELGNVLTNYVDDLIAKPLKNVKKSLNEETKTAKTGKETSNSERIKSLPCTEI